MKRLLFLLLLLLLISVVSASNYDFTAVSNYNDTLTNNNNLGELLILRNGFNSDIINISNYNTINIDIYDNLHWYGNDSIQIQGNNFNTILTPTNNNIFTSVGQYIYTSLLNSSQAGVINVNQINDLSLDVYYEIYDNDSILFSDTVNNVIINSQQKIIDLPYILNSDTEPKSYKIKTVISSEDKNITINDEALLEQIKSFDVTSNTITKETNLFNGESKNIGSISIKNTGNILHTINSEISGNGSSFVTIQKNQTLHKDMTTVFNIFGNSPFKQDNGKYNVTIELNNDKQDYVYSFIVNIKDSTAPIITHHTFDHEYIYKNNTININAQDNNGIKSGNFTIYHKNYKTVNNVSVDYNSTHELDIIDNTLVTGTFIVPNALDYNITICLSDLFDNINCEQFNQEFKKLDIISNNSNIKLLSTKLGKFSNNYLFTLNENISTTLKLDRFTTDIINDTFKNYLLQLKDEDENVYEFTDINTSINISKAGLYYLEIRGENVVEYNGVIKILPTNYSIPEDSINFEGRLLNYSIATPGTKEWLNGNNLTINVHDTGIYETSYTESCVRHTIDTDIDSLSIPATPKQIKAQQELLDNTIEQKNKQIKRSRIGIGFVFFLLISFLVFFWYLYKIMPYKRVRYGKKEDK